MTEQEDFWGDGGGNAECGAPRQQRDSMTAASTAEEKDRQEEHHHFVFRVNYALLSAIEHNLMHISAEDLTLNSANTGNA